MQAMKTRSVRSRPRFRGGELQREPRSRSLWPLDPCSPLSRGQVSRGRTETDGQCAV